MSDLTEEDCRQAVVDALHALAEAQPESVRAQLAELIPDLKVKPADQLDEGRADFIYRLAIDHWRHEWDKVSYGPFEQWTPDNVAACYVKVMAVYDWRFGLGEWMRVLGRDR